MLKRVLSFFKNKIGSNALEAVIIVPVWIAVILIASRFLMLLDERYEAERTVANISQIMMISTEDTWVSNVASYLGVEEDELINGDNEYSIVEHSGNFSNKETFRFKLKKKTRFHGNILAEIDGLNLLPEDVYVIGTVYIYNGGDASV